MAKLLFKLLFMLLTLAALGGVGWWFARRGTRADARATGVARPRLLLLWACAAPLPAAALLSLPAGRFHQFVAAVAGMALLALAFALTRDDTERAAPPFVRPWQRWRWPSLNLAGLAVAAATATIAWLGLGHPAEIALAFAALALVGFHLVYGFDPWLVRRSNGEPLSSLAAATLAEAAARLERIERAAATIAAPELAARLRRIVALGRDILAYLAAHPAELHRARRFLAVFLEGTERVADGYAQAQSLTDAPALAANVGEVLSAIEAHFSQQRAQFRQHDLQDLDLRIEVLRHQLARDGLDADTAAPRD